MTSRPSTRKRKPGVGAHGLRQPLIRSESAAVPKASEIILKPKATLGAEPGGLAEESYKSNQEPGLLNKFPNKEDTANGVQVPNQNQIDVVSKKRVQHRVWVEQNHDEIPTEVPSTPPRSEYSLLLETLKKVREIELSHTNGEMPPKLKDSLLVPKSLKFLGETELRCKFTIENTSERVMTYTVKSTSLSKFEIEPNIGWIRPKSKVRISIQTRSRYVNDFRDISTERFAVFAAPIFIEQQLAQHKLQIYWRAFGSSLFPRWLAEVHRIDTLVAEDGKWFTWLDFIGIYRREYKELEHNFGAADAETFYKIWEVNGSTFSQNLEYQYLEYVQNIDRKRKMWPYVLSHLSGTLKEYQYREYVQNISAIVKVCRSISLSVLLFFAVVAACASQPYGRQFFQFLWNWTFGPFSFTFGKNPPPPPPAWYESLYFWRWF